MKKSYIYALLTVLIWSTMAPVVKLMLSDIPNLQALSISSYLAFVFLLILNWRTGKLKGIKDYRGKDYAVMSGLGFIGLFVYSALYYYGLGNLTAQEACVLNYLWPIMIVLFGVIILKERMNVMKAVAMACSFMGIIILSFGHSSAMDGTVIISMASCVVAAVCYGLYSVLNKKYDYDQNIFQMIVWLIAGLCSMILGMLTEEWIPIVGVQWIGMLWLGIMIDAVAYLLWAIALRDAEDTAKIANMAYLTPFLSLIMSAIIIKEPIQMQAVAALVFIVGGILLQSIGNKGEK